MVDALASGASVRKNVRVQVPPRAPQLHLQDIAAGEHRGLAKKSNDCRVKAD